MTAEESTTPDREVIDANNIYILFINARSIRNKISEFESLLVDKPFSFLAVSEHWLSNDECEQSKINNLQSCAFCTRKTSNHGGSMIYVDKKYDVNIYNEFTDMINMEKHCELSCVYVVALKTYIISLYRSPTGDFNVFLNLLMSLLEKIQHQHNNVILGGDFNVNFNKLDHKVTTLLDGLKTYNLRKLVKFNTRNDNCIDNVFSNIEKDLINVNSFETALSDHYGIAVCVKYPKILKHGPEIVRHRPFTQLGKCNFFNFVSTINWNLVIDDSVNSVNTHSKWKVFIDELISHKNKAFPFKTEKRHTTNCAKWFNSKIREMRETMHLIQEDFNKFPSPKTKILRDNFRNRYKNAIKVSKISSNDNYITKYKNKPKAMWTVINNERKSVNKNKPKCDISCDDFNMYFTNIANILCGDLPTMAQINNDKINTNNNIEFKFSLTTPIKIRDAIQNLNNSTARDIYGFNSDIIKGITNILIGPFTKLVNYIITTSQFPDCLKHAKVIPIHKKGDVGDMNNFRPIAVLPIFSKIVESILKSQIVEYFESNTLFYDSQFGFRSNLSTSNALIELSNLIYSSFENKANCMGSFLDLSKAFDCVSHKLLLNKLKQYNFHTDSLKLIESYLTNRTQVVCLNNNTSNELKISIGVPQGSILGPVLFLVFINDLPKHFDKSSVLLFADDTTVINVGNTKDEVEIKNKEALQTANNWCKNNGLILNTSKTKTLQFSVNHLNQTESTKFLGIQVDSNLTWHSHGDQLANTMSKNIFCLRNLAQKVSSKILLNAYYALTESHLRYGVLIWGHSAIRHRIFALQRRALRIVAGLSYTEDCKACFINWGVLTLPSIYILECLCYIKRNLHKYLHIHDNHNYSTRHKENIYVPKHRLTRSRTGTNYYGIIFFNKLSIQTRNLPFKLFKVRLKEYLLLNAYYSIEEFLNCNTVI